MILNYITVNIYYNRKNKSVYITVYILENAKEKHTLTPSRRSHSSGVENVYTRIKPQLLIVRWLSGQIYTERTKAPNFV